MGSSGWPLDHDIDCYTRSFYHGSYCLYCTLLEKEVCTCVMCRENHPEQAASVLNFEIFEHLFISTYFIVFLPFIWWNEWNSHTAYLLLSKTTCLACQAREEHTERWGPFHGSLWVHLKGPMVDPNLLLHHHSTWSDGIGCPFNCSIPTLRQTFRAILLSFQTPLRSTLW